MREIHNVRVYAVLWITAEGSPIHPQGHALEEVRKEKGDGPGEHDSDHSPNRRLDESALEDSSHNQ